VRRSCVRGIALCDRAPNKGGLDGVWVPEKVVGGGVQSGKEETTSLVIEGASLTRHSAKRDGDRGVTSSIAFAFAADPKQRPPETDLVAKKGPLKGKVSPAIYALDGDTLKIVPTQPGEKRPTSFESKKDSEHVFLALERRKQE
jgi:uncharacterized protein (TIGR03067 family)